MHFTQENIVLGTQDPISLPNITFVMGLRASFVSCFSAVTLCTVQRQPGESQTALHSNTAVGCHRERFLGIRNTTPEK